jgi:O-antigen/teichoic acid export membrane protein
MGLARPCVTTPPRTTLGTGATAVSVAQITAAILGAIVSIIVARSLGPDQTGAFNVIGAALLLTSQLATFGIGIALSFYVARRTWPAEEAFRQVELVACVVGVVAGGVGLLVASLLSDGAFRGIPIDTFAIAMVALPFSLAFYFVTQLSLALERYVTYAVVVVGQMLVYVTGVATLTPFLGLDGAVASSTFALAVAAVGLHIWGRRTLPPARPGWLGRSAERLGHAARFGVKSHASGVLQLMNQRLDIFILNASAAQATVGHYTIAVAVTTIGLLAPRSLFMVVLPRVASLEDASSRAEQRMVLEKTARHAFILGAGTACLLVVGVLLIPLLYGSRFEPSVTPGLILIPGVAMLGVATVLAGATTGKGLPEYSLYTALLVTPPTVLAYLLLIPALEEVGAAVASTGSYAAQGLVGLYFFRRATGFPPLRTLVPRGDDMRDYRHVAARARSRFRSRERGHR